MSVGLIPVAACRSRLGSIILVTADGDVVLGAVGASGAQSDQDEEAVRNALE